MSQTENIQEIARLQAELLTLENEIIRIANKLNNPGFITRVPAVLIEKERSRMADFQQLQAQVQQKIALCRAD